MKKLLSLILTFALCLAMASCTQETEPKVPENIVNPIGVSISIQDNPEDDVTVDGFQAVEKTDFTVEEGTNVLDATQLFCISNDIPIQLDSAGTNIASMSGAGEKDVETTTGWVYKINGEDVSVGANEKILEDGDEISWEFIDFTSYGW